MFIPRPVFAKSGGGGGGGGDSKPPPSPKAPQELSGVALVDELPRIDIEKPRWDQSVYWGRAKHFFVTTNPLNLLKTSSQLEESRRIVHAYRKSEKLPGVTVDQLWRAKQVYDSAFHPDTGEKMILVGRMSAQVPANMVIAGGMMTWYKTWKGALTWQWINQSFNAVVNYTNRSGPAPITVEHLGQSYVLATTSAVAVAIGLNKMAAVFPPVVGRMVPFAAIAAAHACNIPMMRRNEIADGIPVFDSAGNQIGLSKKAAIVGIQKVYVSRVSMAIPYMLTIPFLMDHLERNGFLKRYPWSSLPIQTVLCGVVLTFATPLCCALFQQMAPIKVTSLEPHIQEAVKKMPNPPDRLWFNKGL